ncbi:MAG TPA: PAS domain S-box protein [Vicinamibacterales bacterium]|nr:PAS domain S-box protein [Vicinamibacterales bacterium]
MSTILIVDDVATNRNLLVALLRCQGHRLLEAAHGAEGLAAVRAERPDLVITDVLMPVMDGYEFVRQLRLDPATSRIPVVFSTAHYGEREARAFALSIGVSFVLTKPVESEQVLRIVGRALAGETETGRHQGTSPLATAFDREHLRLITNKLSEKAGDLNSANARLRALINIGLELASERDAARLLHNVCIAARDLFGATYVTLGILDANERTVQHFVTDGTAAASWITIGDAVPGILRTVVTERRTLRGDNVRGDPATLQLPPLHPTVHAFLTAPLASPAHVYGWICLVGNEGRTFTDDDEALVMALAGQVGRIYENGYLYSVAKNERDRAQRYLDTAQIILLALDLEGRITQVNRYACSMLGWTADELLGRDWIETCLPARMRDALRTTFRDLLGGDLSVVENPILTRSGEERLIEWRNTVLRDGAGHTIGTFSSGTDITERTRAQEELRLQGAALNASANAIVITDREGLIHWSNPAFSELTGYTAAEATGRNPRDLVKSDQHDQAFYKNLWDTIQSGQVWRGEMTNRRKDGSLYTEEQTITPVRDEQRELTHFIAVKQDTTERNRVAEEARQRVLLSELGAAIGVSLAEADSLGEALQRCAEALVTHLGAAFARVWTLNQSENVLELQASAGLYTHLNGPHGRVPLGQFKIGRIARDRKPHLTNTVVGDPEVSDQEWARQEGMVGFAGHPLIVSDRVVGVMALFARHALSDSVMSALTSVADHIALGIERHRSGEALRTAEERMRFALENADVGIWDMDYTTGVLRWSNILEAHYGVVPGTFGGTFEAFVDRIHPDDRASVLETVGKAMKAGSEFSVQNRSIWPDGTVRWLSGMGRVVLGEHGEPVRAVGISLDNTERRTLEAQYQQAQKMEAVGRLAGGVAHDFNNLLTVILGYCELLLTDFNPDDPRQADIVEIQKAGARAGGLTRQLLAFSRKQIIEPTLLDLNRIAADLQPMLGRLIGEDVKVVLRLRPALARVSADRGQVEQVVMNLAVNARDAMPRGGTLTIETANVELDEHYARMHRDVKPGPYVVLTVTDTGTGMTPQVQARLFEPFFTTKEPGKGTGLGMATVYGIVTRCGGRVGVYSEVGRGTSINVYFPRADAAGTIVDTPLHAVEPRAGTQTVLVVEDEDVLRELAKRLLERQGYSVLLAADAGEALRMFEQNPSIDVLLTDVVMPGTSGPDLTKQLIEQRPELRVIYMSGYTEDAIVHHGVLKPGIAFLHKPFTSETLGRKIRDVLDMPPSH